MENQKAPITLLQLTERQLRDWKEVLAEKREANPNDPDLEYCEIKIEELEADVARLKS